MRRREVLAGVSTLLSGCATASPRRTLTPAPVPTTRDERGTATESASDGDGPCPETYRPGRPPFASIPDPPERYAGLDCPVWGGRLVCYHRAELDAVPAALVSYTHLADLVGDGGDVVEFVLVNRSDGPISFEAGTWAVFASVAAAWTPVSIGRRGCRRALPPGGAHWWRVGVRTDPGPGDRRPVTTVRVGLDPGTYAFGLPVTLADGQALTCVAPWTVRRIVGATGPGDRSATDSRRRLPGPP